MTSTILRPEEEAVLGAVIFQRINSDGDIFEYDRKAVHDRLNQTGDSVKHIITPDVQRRIVMDLSKKRIIDMDQMIDERLSSLFSLSISSGYILPPRRPKLFWLNQTRWAYEKFQENGNISIEEAYTKYGNAMFIRMTEYEAINLANSYISDHLARLRIDMDRTRLCIKFDDEDDWLFSPALHEDKDPFKILCYAFSNPNRKINCDELFTKGGIDVRDKYLGSQVFSDNGAVKALSQTQLLDLEGKWLRLRKAAKLTKNKADELRSVFKF